MADFVLLLSYIIIQTGLIFLSLMFFKIPINPLSIYSLIFLFAVIFNFFLPIYHPSGFTWLLLYLADLMFFLGALGGLYFSKTIIFKNGLKKKNNFDDFSFSSQKKIYTLLAWISIIIIFFYLLAFFLINLNRFKDILTTSGSFFVSRFYYSFYSKETWSLPYISGIMLLGIMAVGILDGFLFKLQKKTILLFFLIMIFEFFMGTRTILLASIFIYFFSFCLSRNAILKKGGLSLKKNKKTVGRRELLIIFLAILVSSTITIFRIPQAKIDWQITETRGVSDFFLIELGGGNIARLEAIFRNQENLNHSPGAFTFGPVMRFLCYLFMDKETCREKFPFIQPFTNIPIIWNIGTYITDLYLDFNILGVIIGSLLLAFLTSVFFIVALEKNLNFLPPAIFFMTLVALSFRFIFTFAGSFWVMVFCWLIFILIYKTFFLRNYLKYE